jgi:hypothetical protein
MTFGLMKDIAFNEPSRIIHEFFWFYKDKDTLVDILNGRAQMRRPVNPNPEQFILDLSEFIFTLYESKNHQPSHKREKTMIQSVKALLIEVFKALLKVFQNNSITLTQNPEATKKFFEDFRDPNRKEIYEKLQSQKFENAFESQKKYVIIYAAQHFDIMIQDFIKQYFIDYVFNAWDEKIINAYLSSEVFSSLKLTNPNDPVQLRLMRELLYSVGLVEFNQEFDDEYLGEKNYSVFSNSRLMVI